MDKETAKEIANLRGQLNTLIGVIAAIAETLPERGRQDVEQALMMPPRISLEISEIKAAIERARQAQRGS